MKNMLVKSLVVGVAMMAFALCAGVALFSRIDYRELDDAVAKIETATIFSTANHIFARDGSLIDQYADDSQKFISIDDLPGHVRQAFISAEDKEFYRHHGISLRGVVRAVVKNAASGDVREGASTITQQLARMFFLTRERTLKRKISEAILALKLERRFTKKIILEAYLNNIFLGPGAKGIENAARVYFGKHARDLDVGEAAMLAGLAPAPSRYQPKRDMAQARVRQAYVLRRMAADGFITRQDAERWMHKRIILGHKSPRTLSQAVYFREAALEEARRLLGRDEIEGLNLAIYTEFDLKAQDRLDAMARETLNDPLWEGGKAGDRQVAAVAYDAATGGLLALRGGSSFQVSQFNRAFRTRRSMGDTVLPFLYAVALENGWGLDAPLYEMPRQVRRHASGALNQAPTIFDGLAGNLLPESLRLLYALGTGTVEESARDFGWPEDRALPQIILGNVPTTLLDQAQRFGAFANGGGTVEPFLVARIVDASGKEIFKKEASQAHPIMSAESAYILGWAMRKALEVRAGIVTDAVGSALTGFGADKQDAWLFASEGSLVVALWVGQDRGGRLVDDKNPSIQRRLAASWLRTLGQQGKYGEAGQATVPPFVGFHEMQAITLSHMVGPFNIKNLSRQTGLGTFAPRDMTFKN